jgi:hypothetical protein
MERKIKKRELAFGALSQAAANEKLGSLRCPAQRRLFGAPCQGWPVVSKGKGQRKANKKIDGRHWVIFFETETTNHNIRECRSIAAGALAHKKKKGRHTQKHRTATARRSQERQPCCFD